MPTNNKGLNQPVLSSPSWGTPLNDNAAILDKALGSFTTISNVTGTANLTLSQCQNMCIKTTTSAFLTNVTFVIPSGVAGQWVFTNQSATSSFSLIVRNAASGVSVMIPSGITRTVYSDGSIVFFVDTQSISTFQNLSIGTGFSTTGATCSGTSATVTFGGGFLISVGQTISIKGVTPSGYNGIWTVTASSAGSVTFVVPEALASQSVAGILYYGAIAGSTLDLSGRGSVSGVATQAEAQTGTDNTTLMTPLRTKEALNASGSAPMYISRAWVFFDGSASGTPVIGGGNVSSITDHSTGNYTINFTTAMPDTNYNVVASCSMANSAVSSGYDSDRGTKTTSSVSIVNLTSSNNEADRLTSVSIFR